jgi:nitrous oxidase accessory protein
VSPQDSWAILALLAWLAAPLASAGLVSLQPLVDEAEPGAVLLPEPGVYAGPLVIDKPLTLDGRDQVTLDGGGKGTIVLLDTDGATLKNLRLTHSGDSHNDIDSGVHVRGNFNVIKDNVIDNCLFGIDLQQSNNNIVRRNRISSKPVDLGIRGDAIRFWYSYNNQATDNIIRDSRDTVVWYSKDNLIARNDARGGRYSLHFMYSHVNQVEDNYYENNTVGIFVMYSDGLILRNNTVINASGPTGVGIGFKDSSDVEISGNKILYSATGIYLDLSPYQPGTTNRFSNNLIAFNSIGVRWLPGRDGNIFIGNRFEGNITQVVLEGGAGKGATFNTWEGNFWDDYEGFDRDGDGIGDTPHEQYAYADRLWMDLPAAQFFKGSPMLEVIDFLERLAPLSEPKVLARDDKPMRSVNMAIATLADMARPPVGAPVEEYEEDKEAQDAAESSPAAVAPAGFDAYQALRRSLGQD